MYDVENKMVAEGNYEMTKQAYISMYKQAYEVDSPEDESEEAYWQYLMDQIDYIEPVRTANTADLRDLLDDLEEATN